MTIAPVLVFGENGQLARELARLSTVTRPVICAGRSRCDLAGAADPRSLIEQSRPRAVINAAAYTAVDQAESEREAAFALNCGAPATLARACATIAVPFIHLSTDYVFDGSQRRAYVEDDERAPLGVYGASKAAGEDAVMAAGGCSAIVRTAWLYSAFGSNFPKTMLRLAATRDEVGVVGDQHGSPTSAREIASALLDLADRMAAGELAASGVFHASNRGEASWADFAQALFERSRERGGPAARVRRITTDEYPTPARRPSNSRLDPGRLERLLGVRFRDWREPLDALIAELVPVQEAVSK